jgi:hypothetical protein
MNLGIGWSTDIVLLSMKTAANDRVHLDSTYEYPIECNQLLSCQPCDPRRIGQLNEGRLPGIASEI